MCVCVWGGGGGFIVHQVLMVVVVVRRRRKGEFEEEDNQAVPSATLSRSDKLPTVPFYQGAPISMKASWLAANYFAVSNNL